MPTMKRTDGRKTRPWFKPEENTEEAAKALLARKLIELDESRLPAPTEDTVAGGSSSSWPTRRRAVHVEWLLPGLRRRIEHDKIGVGRIKLRKLTAVRLDRFYRDLKAEGYARATIQQTHRS